VPSETELVIGVGQVDITPRVGIELRGGPGTDANAIEAALAAIDRVMPRRVDAGDL
jgi:hypothetical protein